MKRAAAIVLTGAMAALSASSGCGGEEAARPPTLVAMTPPPDASRNRESTPIVDAGTLDAEPPPRAPRLVPEPVWGAGSVKPNEPHPFRLVVSISAAQKNAAAAQLLELFDRLPAVSDWEERTGVPVRAGDALLVYGKEIGLPGANASVLRLPRAVALTPVPSFQAFGVRDAVLHPHPTLVAFVPSDRASDFEAALKAPFDFGVKPGEVARVTVAELPRVMPLPEQAKQNLLLVVKPATDHGLDAAFEVDCGVDAAKCAAVASDVTDFVARSNSIMVRLATRGILNGFTARVDGKKLKATLHITPEQMDANLRMASAIFGLPEPSAVDAGAP